MRTLHALHSASLAAVMVLFGCSSDSDSNVAPSNTTADASPQDSAAHDSASVDSAADPDGSSGTCLDSIAWYSNNATGTATSPGKKTANAYGLFDMLGNAVEWVQDCYHATYSGGPASGLAWEEDNCEYRVIRGGCYGSTARGARVSWRDGVKTSFYGACAPGVRCVRTSSDTPATAKITMQWVKVPAGSFVMGCSTGDTGCYDNESPAHTVSVGAFEMTAREATQQEVFDQTGDTAASSWCADCSETYMTWENAKAFCEALGGRLPTEAEWEYAARGGTSTKYYCGDQ